MKRALSHHAPVPAKPDITVDAIWDLERAACEGVKGSILRQSIIGTPCSVCDFRFLAALRRCSMAPRTFEVSRRRDRPSYAVRLRQRAELQRHRCFATGAYVSQGGGCVKTEIYAVLTYGF